MQFATYIYICKCPILLNQKLPGELEMDSTTAISSYLFFVEGKRQKTNPSEKMPRRSRPHKLMET